MNEYITVDEVNDVLKEYALKSELEEVKTKIDNTSKAQQDLAILVGEHVASIVTINSKISNLERENATLKDTIAAMEARLTALANRLTRIKYTFSVPNSTSIRYQFEQPFDAYEATLYLNYNETKDNVTSVKEIKINISYNVNNTPTYEYQCEPTKIWINNIEFPLSSSNLMVNPTANFILINTTFFTSNGILAEDNTKNEIHSL